MKNRLICTVEGCKNLGRPSHKRKDGSKGRGKLCTKHHNLKYNMINIGSRERKKKRKFGETYCMDRSRCVLCGWNKAECDRHRIVFGCNGGKYTLKNVISVCPNCHRLLHRGLLKIKY